MGKKGKKAQAGKPKKLTPKEIGKRLDALVKKLEEELKGADLFAPLPPTEDCAICCLPLSRVFGKSAYNACCQKWICTGCDRGHGEFIELQNEKHKRSITHTCPFCRAPEPSTVKEYARQLEARTLENDKSACISLAAMMLSGEHDEVPEDKLKALELCIRAADLGSPEACSSIASYYQEGTVIPRSLQRATLFDRVGAVRGSIVSRHGIGIFEYYDAGNHKVGIRHWKIAAEGGMQLSLDELKKIYLAKGKCMERNASAKSIYISSTEFSRRAGALHRSRKRMMWKMFTSAE